MLDLQEARSAPPDLEDISVEATSALYPTEDSDAVAKAMAKVSFRLVPNQSPEKVRELLTAHVQKVAPPEVTVRIKELSLLPDRGTFAKPRTPVPVRTALCWRTIAGVAPSVDGTSSQVECSDQDTRRIQNPLCGPPRHAAAWLGYPTAGDAPR